MTVQIASSDLSLQPPPVILNPGAEYADFARMFQGIPAIECASSGRLWAAWYGGGDNEGPDNYVMLATSGDGGQSWSSPMLIVDPPHPVRAYDPALWIDPLGRLWLFWAQSEQWWDGRGGVWAIRTDNPNDPAPTWSAPFRIADGVMMNKPTVLKNGTWLAPVAMWQMKEIHPDVKVPTGAGVYQSTDHGATWTLAGNVAVPAAVFEFEEHMIVEKLDGKLWMLVRTNYGIGESFSSDGGVTWSPLKPSIFEHTSARFFIRRLQSGHLLMAKHSPLHGLKRRSHLTAYLSTDDAKTWSSGMLLDVREGISYPDGVERADGLIYIIYDFDRMKTKTIHLSAFTENDIQLGHMADARCLDAAIVNQATGKNPKAT